VIITYLNCVGISDRKVTLGTCHKLICSYARDQFEHSHGRAGYGTFMFRPPALVHAGRNVFYLSGNPSNDCESADERASSRNCTR